MPTCLSVEYDDSTVAQATDIPSNFDVNDWIFATPGNPQCNVDGTDGKLRINCVPSHLAYDDPIVYPGQPGHAHLHHFFGNTLTNHSSTYASLRAAGDGTCSGGPINRTGYWHPAIIRPQNNKVVRPTSHTIYYTVGTERFDRCDAIFGWQYASQHLPRGFSMIGGWPDRVTNLDLHAVTTAFPSEPFRHSAAPTSEHVWIAWNSAGVPTGPAGTFDELADMCVAAGTCAEATSNSTSKLIGRFSFPTCWDGENLTSATGRTHVTYARQNGEGLVGCPASHPFHIPDVLVAMNIDHNGREDFRQWYLSSDDGHGPPDAVYPGGHTVHYDWFGAWDQGIVDIFSEHVMGIQSYPSPSVITCNNGGLNNGYALKELHLGEHEFVAESGRYLDIPAEPGEDLPGSGFFFRT